MILFPLLVKKHVLIGLIFSEYLKKALRRGPDSAQCNSLLMFHFSGTGSYMLIYNIAISDEGGSMKVLKYFWKCLCGIWRQRGISASIDAHKWETKMENFCSTPKRHS